MENRSSRSGRLLFGLVCSLLLTVSAAARQHPCASIAEDGCAENGSDSEPVTWLDSEWDGLPHFESDGGLFTLELGGRFQLDYRNYFGEALRDDGLFVRRARIRAEGRLSSVVDYKLQLQFGIGREDFEIKDAYLDIETHDRLRIQLGQFKAPFSQEELQSSKYGEFVERSLLNNLAPGRALGVLFYGASDSEIFQYEFAAVELTSDIDALGEAGFDTERRHQREIYARGRLSPWHSPILENLSFGGALGYGLPGGESVLSVETSSESLELFEPIRLEGSTLRRNLEAWWWYDNVALQGEYLHWAGERGSPASLESEPSRVSANGFMIQGLVILTGEKKTDGGIRPERPLFRGGFGAVELGVRYDFLEWDGESFANRVDSWTAGVNWWMYDRLHYRIDFSWDRFRRPPFIASLGDRTRFTVLSRVQIFF